MFKPRSVSLSVLQLRSVQREPCCRTVQEGECAADELVGQTLALTLTLGLGLGLALGLGSEAVSEE